MGSGQKRYSTPYIIAFSFCLSMLFTAVITGVAVWFFELTVHYWQMVTILAALLFLLLFIGGTAAALSGRWFFKSFGMDVPDHRLPKGGSYVDPEKGPSRQ
jgi:hypothetical protein